jgi:hypothetical protein
VGFTLEKVAGLFKRVGLPVRRLRDGVSSKFAVMTLIHGGVNPEGRAMQARRDLLPDHAVIHSSLTGRVRNVLGRAFLSLAAESVFLITLGV